MKYLIIGLENNKNIIFIRDKRQLHEIVFRQIEHIFYIQFSDSFEPVIGYQKITWIYKKDFCSSVTKINETHISYKLRQITIFTTLLVFRKV